MKIIKKNMSSKYGFEIECQKCKCKKVSLQVSYSEHEDEEDSYCIVCNHCKYKEWII